MRRAIAKKKGTETLIPEIEKRFVDYSSTHYDITRERCEEVIKPFLQIILDASDYGFSWNHSDPYSATGYICGYLRYYYPYEFLTSALNIFGDDIEKTSRITKYAQRVGIQVTMPKWGISKSNYFFDKEKKIISKGISSIKYMNSSIAEELYDLAHSRKFDRFVDVLYEIDKTSMNTRQLDILIKLDFFSDFGNQRELLRITDMFYNMFKKGEAKQLKRSIVEGTPLKEIVEKYSIGKTKSGEVSRNYILTDTRSIIQEAEDAILSLGLSDLGEVTKVKNFQEFMGYAGYVSGKEEDRQKLYIVDVIPLLRKADRKQFGYSVVTKSIGSGIESRFTVLNSVYKKEPINKGDVICCTGWEREGQFFRMTSYYKIREEVA